MLTPALGMTLRSLPPSTSLASSVLKPPEAPCTEKEGLRRFQPQEAVSPVSCLQLSLDGGTEAPDHSLETPHSPLYADPYTPPATSHRKITDVQNLDEVSPLLGDRKSWCAHSLRLRGYRSLRSAQATVGD